LGPRRSRAAVSWSLVGVEGGTGVRRARPAPRRARARAHGADAPPLSPRQSSLATAPDAAVRAAERDLDARVGAVMDGLLAAASFDTAASDAPSPSALPAALAAAAGGALEAPGGELAEVRARVEAARARVARLRAAAPAALRDALASHLAAGADADAADADAEAAAAPAPAAAGDDDASPPPPAELAATLAAALDALPSVRARLDEAADRLAKAVAAVEAEAEVGGGGVTAALASPGGAGGAPGPGDAARRLARELRAGLPR